MKGLWLIPCILLIACGKPERCIKQGKGDTPDMIRNVDPDMEEYVHRFENDIGHDINFQVKFEELSDNKAGECIQWTNGAKLVKIKKSYFMAINEYRKEQLLYHELGHCELNKDHNDSTKTFNSRAGTWPASVMRNTAFSESESNVYKEERNYYVQELIGG